MSPLDNQKLEILSRDHVLNRAHSDFEKRGISSISKVTVDDLLWSTGQIYELVHKVCTCLLPASRIALKIRESEFGDVASGYL